MFGYGTMQKVVATLYSALASGVGYPTPTNQGIRAHTVDCYKVYPFGGYTS